MYSMCIICVMTTKRIDITMNKQQLKFLDDYCRQEMITRSQVIRTALREYFLSKKGKVQEFANGEIISEAEAVKTDMHCHIAKCKNKGVVLHNYRVILATGNLEKETRGYCPQHQKDAIDSGEAELID